MPSITLTDPVTGTTVATGLIATNNGNLRTLLNSGLDGVNLKGNPALAAREFPVWDGSQFVRSSAGLTSTTYVPIWTTSGTAPVLGNGTLTGTYQQVGKLTFAQIVFFAGSSTTFGTGGFFFSLPIAAESNSIGQGIVWLYDISSNTTYFGNTTLQAINTVGVYFNSVSGSNVVTQGTTSTAPFTWATGDGVRINLWYWVA